ncbi:hypothetical protein F5X98DRAFT_382919 [Xylaria grammica]|nr:hypothetical protein F5X98DRAFT_382919 [Xylaria grammica]
MDTEPATKFKYAAVSREDDEELNALPDLYAVRVWKRRFYILLTSSLIGILFLIGSQHYVQNASHCQPDMRGVKMPYTPAPVRYVNRNMTSDFDSPRFLGNPRPELDEAWHELLAGTAISLSEEDLRLADAPGSVRLKSGGYIGGLGISHSLHCIKRIKQYIHPEYYYSGGQQDWDEIHRHADHCLESLRVEALCKADPSVYTYVWTPHNRVKPAVQITQKAACVDWEGLHTWMKGRAASKDDMVGPPASLFE